MGLLACWWGVNNVIWGGKTHPLWVCPMPRILELEKWRCALARTHWSLLTVDVTRAARSCPSCLTSPPRWSVPWTLSPLRCFFPCTWSQHQKNQLRYMLICDMMGSSVGSWAYKMDYPVSHPKGTGGGAFPWIKPENLLLVSSGQAHEEEGRAADFFP